MADTVAESPAIRLNHNERCVLDFLAAFAPWDHCYISFAPISNGTGLDRKQVRRACRSLARKGLSEYAKGLWNDEGSVAGSGYCATKAGVEMMNGHA